jgi:hypothetical protein
MKNNNVRLQQTSNKSTINYNKTNRHTLVFKRFNVNFPAPYLTMPKYIGFIVLFDFHPFSAKVKDGLPTSQHKNLMYRYQLTNKPLPPYKLAGREGGQAMTPLLYGPDNRLLVGSHFVNSNSSYGVHRTAGGYAGTLSNGVTSRLSRDNILFHTVLFFRHQADGFIMHNLNCCLKPGSTIRSPWYSKGLTMKSDM